jgi:hypothetical protein
MKIQKAMLFTLTLLLAGTAQARDSNLLFQFGLDMGGDELAKVTYTNGDTETIDAGGLFQLALGTTFQTAPESHPNLETQLSLGLKLDLTTAENGDLTWSRIPVEVLEFYTTPQWRFGGGLTYHMNPSLDGSGEAANINVDFDNALGAILEVDYITAGKTYVGGRVTLIDYTVGSTKLSGNSVGVTVGVRF